MCFMHASREKSAKSDPAYVKKQTKKTPRIYCMCLFNLYNVLDTDNLISP